MRKYVFSIHRTFTGYQREKQHLEDVGAGIEDYDLAATIRAASGQLRSHLACLKDDVLGFTEGVLGKAEREEQREAWLDALAPLLEQCREFMGILEQWEAMELMLLGSHRFLGLDTIQWLRNQTGDPQQLALRVATLLETQTPERQDAYWPTVRECALLGRLHDVGRLLVAHSTISSVEVNGSPKEAREVSAAEPNPPHLHPSPPLLHPHLHSHSHSHSNSNSNSHPHPHPHPHPKPNPNPNRFKRCGTSSVCLLTPMRR